MDRQDALAALHVGTIHDDAAIETARTEERRIENVGTVGGGNENDAFVRFEAIHFDEQLIQRLLALIMPASEAGATVTADRVDFVDEHDARRIFLALLEEVADAARPDADEHLDEIRPADR